MSQKFKIDKRVNLLKYINKKGQVELYPEIGFPLSVFVCVEHAPATLLTNSSLNVSEFCFTAYPSYRAAIAAGLRSLLMVGGYSLLEHTLWVSNTASKQARGLTSCSVFASLHTHVKVIDVSQYPAENITPSLSGVFPNAVWMEREASEMFGVLYDGLRDTRRLLLDYSTPRGLYALPLQFPKNTNNVENFKQSSYNYLFFGITTATV